MNTLRPLTAALAAVLWGLVVAPGHAAATKTCAAQAACVETGSFVATLTNFRTSTQGRYRVLTATVRFENRSNKPLILGYVRGSGVALDDRGNRYGVAGANAVRAIGEIAGNTFDPKFTLQPGQGSDARFELMWEPGKAIVGTSYELDLAVREIASIAGDQFRLGAEHALHFTDLTQASAKAAPSTATATPTGESAAWAATPAATAATPSAAPAQIADPCEGSPRCYNAGTFIAEVMQVSPGNMTAGVRHHTLTLHVRFGNVSDKPIVLAYRASSSAGMDNFGNHYYWGRAGTHDTSVKGIGIIDSRNADSQFALSPGQSRSATFNVVRFNAKPPYGNGFGYDVVIDELEILPGQQIRSTRQNSVSFTNLTAGTFSGVGPAAPVDAVDTANKVIDLFKTLRKK